MKPTGYALLALAALLMAYAGVSHLIYDVGPIERAGTEHPAMSNGGYWLALIPATVSAAIGLYMVLIRERGYRTTYDLGKQQTPWTA